VFPPPPTIPPAASTGLPSYTVPPAGGSRPAPPSFGVGGSAPGRPPFGAISEPTAKMSTPPAQAGPPPTPVSTPPAQISTPPAQAGTPPTPISTPPAQAGTPSAQPGTPSAQAGEEDPAATMAVPQQRHIGTLYGTGGYDVIDMTMPVNTNSMENSGSLTGHILAQGWRDEIVDRRRSNLKVAVAMLVVLGLLVTVSLVFLLTAGNAFTDMISGVFN
jgi:hypothetical protein